ncbi:hypothetical protein ACQFX6_32075 [Streptomyces sp. DSM 41987]
MTWHSSASVPELLRFIDPGVREQLCALPVRTHAPIGQEGPEL